MGNGRLHVFGSAPAPIKMYVARVTDVRYDTQDGIFDIAWSEVHENQIASAGGDGSIKLWDISLDVSHGR